MPDGEEMPRDVQIVCVNFGRAAESYHFLYFGHGAQEDTVKQIVVSGTLQEGSC